MPKYRKLPVVIEAVRIKNKMTVETLEGTMTGEVGDWLITGVAGEQYFCKNDIFEKTYELVVEGISQPHIQPLSPYVPGPFDWQPQWPYGPSRPWEQSPIVYGPIVPWCNAGIVGTAAGVSGAQGYNGKFPGSFTFGTVWVVPEQTGFYQENR